MYIDIWYTKVSEFMDSLGRNGPAQTIGLSVLWYKEKEIVQPDKEPEIVPALYRIYPLTSKKNLQSCYIEVPVVDFWRLVKQMEDKGLRPQGE